MLYFSCCLKAAAFKVGDRFEFGRPQDIPSSGRNQGNTSCTENQNVKCVFIASDCDEFMTQAVRELCESRQIPVISAFTKKEIGRACGIKVKAAACAVIEPR